MKTHLIIFFIGILHFLSFGQTISYKINMSEPHTHYFEVEMTIKNYDKDFIDFQLPVWAPGSYLVREFSKSIENFQAYSNSENLSFELVNKNTWRVANKNKNVTIKYKVYAFEMSVRTSFLDADHGYINGTSIFMFVEDLKELPVSLSINPYVEWKKITTALKSSGNNVYTAENYDVFVDAPIEIGNHQTFEFEADGIPHTVAVFGEGNFSVDSLKKDMKKIAESCTKVFGENPNKDYTFIVHNLSNSSGGLEHLNSTTLQVERWSYAPTSNYQRFLSLVAHEYFHLWNVKRLRPKNLGPFDYNHECYTELLWVSEGFTSYYDELLLQRTGYYDNETYLKKLAENITGVENQPGNNVQPVSEASFNAWIKAYRRNENSYNTTISYYPKGAILGLLVDLEIIKATNGSKNLDDLMQVMYSKYFKELDQGFTEENIKVEIENLLGYNLDLFFNEYVNGTKTIDYNKYFSYVGLELSNQPLKSGDKINFGAKLSNNEGKLIVKSVVRGTPAYKFGINAKDEIIAINNYRVDYNTFDKVLNQYALDDNIEVTVTRDGVVRNLNIKLEEANMHNFALKKIENMSEEQKICLEKWLQ